MEKIDYYKKYRKKNKNFEYRECYICRYNFYAPINIKNIKTCSKYCSSVLLRKRKLKGKYKLCKVCDKPIWCQPKRNHSYCSKECADRGTSIYTKDRNIVRNKYKKYYGENWLSQRNMARERDFYTCQICGITEDEYGMQLSVHHVKPFLLCSSYIEANMLENLLSLCEPCHRKVHSGKNHPNNYLK